MEAIKEGKDDFEFRRDLMIKAYEHTAAYDKDDSKLYEQRFKGGLGDKLFVSGKSF